MRYGDLIQFEPIETVVQLQHANAIDAARGLVKSGDRTAFVTAGEMIVAHGACALEEVIVPFVTIERRMPS